MGSQLSTGVCCKSPGTGKDAIDGEAGGGFCSCCWCCCNPVPAVLQDVNGKPILLDENFESMEEDDETMTLDTAPLVKKPIQKCNLQRKPAIKKQPKKARKEQQQ
ncbi:myristylated tegument protein [Proboscivirus elephantidbeta5]|uniref:Myristylated tegument protein n=3 Tax=Elephant endotheliotropic herpesvirus 5 TaxID=768738 RepID=A0A075CZL8_9BETA|nr:myristylated tegument protein [Elephant endotheliotropic herpesvirus 5]AHC02863.1 myristylated tegument protein [Elephant endotheliotropic herpesvirus 5]